MNAALRVFAALAAIVATTALAGTDERSGSTASSSADPAWEFAITAYPTVVRGGDNYTSTSRFRSIAACCP